MSSQEKKGDDGYWFGVMVLLLVFVVSVVVIFIDLMPKPVDVTKITFEKPMMVPYTVDGVEVDKQAELKLNEDAIREFIASETDRHNHYLTIVSIMMALFGIFGSVVAIGMGISLSLKERGIDQQLKEYEAKIEQGTKDAQNRLKEINQEKDKVQEQFYYYVLENAKPALIHEDFIYMDEKIREAKTIQTTWLELRREFTKGRDVGYYNGGILQGMWDKLAAWNEQESRVRELDIDLLVIQMYLWDIYYGDWMISRMSRLVPVSGRESVMITYPSLLSFSARYVSKYRNIYNVSKYRNIYKVFPNHMMELDQAFEKVLVWLNGNMRESRSKQELLAVNGIYKKVKAEIEDKEKK